ncbi:NADH-quinone oxidoreductase subunit NuoN [Agitococcus lubricus]|uniref:NADH-quinone oxidoreductase subunit N n=1 Tax=Agitococcus lubricus TaxID=1077255 RepID=A0A2T5J402_9GAMM|nr:NADH-quinone oxidoreductase subunit NuoN [Agitococcus lubricus]PTQ91349.1 NADH dehydrogenase subunit N [Agitococcus lubricus]
MNVTLDTFLPLLPILILCTTTVILMLAISFVRHHWWNATISVVGLNLALVSTVLLGLAKPAGLAAIVSQLGIPQFAPAPVMSLLVVDAYAYFYMTLILVAALACTTLTHAFLERYQINREEMYLLLLMATTGALVLVCSRHMTSFFIGLELMSVPVYGMVAYTYHRSRSLESGVKYLVLSATASAFMLFGMALIYAQTGTLAFSGVSEQLAGGAKMGTLASFGVGMIIIALCFKLSLAPFHLWTPDVYQGSPAPVGAFLATISKIAVFAVMIRFLVETPFEYTLPLREVFTIVAVLSIVVGNLLALRQNNLKRLLGYSSIAHFGYLLVAIASGGATALETTHVYLLTYVLTSLGAFGVVTLMSSAEKDEDADSLQHYRGLFWRRPYLTAVMTVMMLSLAGIPLTAGFMGKFYVVLTGVNTGSWGLLTAVVLGSAIGLYYYLRVMVTLYMASSNMPKHDADSHWGERAGGLMVLGVAGLVLFIGIYPQPALEFVRMAKLLIIQ